MKSSNISRRALLTRACQLPAAMGALVLIGACGDKDKEPALAWTCVDPAELDLAQRSLRASLSYTDQSTIPDQTCGVCVYFQAGDPADCGKCQIFNGVVSAGGRCISWGART